MRSVTERCGGSCRRAHPLSLPPRLVLGDEGFEFAVLNDQIARFSAVDVLLRLETARRFDLRHWFRCWRTSATDDHEAEHRSQ